MDSGRVTSPRHPASWWRERPGVAGAGVAGGPAAVGAIAVGTLTGPGADVEAPRWVELVATSDQASGAAGGEVLVGTVPPDRQWDLSRVHIGWELAEAGTATWSVRRRSGDPLPRSAAELVATDGFGDLVSVNVTDTLDGHTRADDHDWQAGPLEVVAVSYTGPAGAWAVRVWALESPYGSVPRAAPVGPRRPPPLFVPPAWTISTAVAIAGATNTASNEWAADVAAEVTSVRAVGTAVVPCTVSFLSGYSEGSVFVATVTIDAPGPFDTTVLTPGAAIDLSETALHFNIDGFDTPDPVVTDLVATATLAGVHADVALGWAAGTSG